MLVYLSGAIEYSPDHGKSWRAEITPFLRQLGHDVYDPAQDEKKNLTDIECREFRAWKHSDLPRFQRTIRKIIAYDLDWIEHRANYIVAYWDEYAARGEGCQAELTVAHRRGIPVYLVTGSRRATLEAGSLVARPKSSSPSTNSNSSLLCAMLELMNRWSHSQQYDRW